MCSTSQPAVSEDGSYVYFVANGVLAPGAAPGRLCAPGPGIAAPEATCNLYVWHNGTTSFIATLSDEDSGDWGSTEGPGRRGQFDRAEAGSRQRHRGLIARRRYFAFMSDRSLTGYDNRGREPRGERRARRGGLPLRRGHQADWYAPRVTPSGERPRGVLDTQNAGEGLGLLVDRPEDWVLSASAAAPTAHWLAASLPGWTPLGNESAAAGAAPAALPL